MNTLPKWILRFVLFNLAETEWMPLIIPPFEPVRSVYGRVLVIV